MNWADYAIIGIILLSVSVSVLRGFVKEALSLITWIAALGIALAFFDRFADFFAPWIGVPSGRQVVAFVTLFVAVLICGAIINVIVSGLVQKTGLSGTDRVAGVVFGLARGIIVVALLVLSAGMTALPQDPWWRESQLMGHFQDMAIWMRGFLPEDLAENIRYDYYEYYGYDH